MSVIAVREPLSLQNFPDADRLLSGQVTVGKGLGVAANRGCGDTQSPTGPSFMLQNPGRPSTEQNQGPATRHPDLPPVDPGYVLRTHVRNRWTLDLRARYELPGVEQVWGCRGAGKSPLFGWKRCWE